MPENWIIVVVYKRIIYLNDLAISLEAILYLFLKWKSSPIRVFSINFEIKISYRVFVIASYQIS
jgi:hypothetical protein